MTSCPAGKDVKRNHLSVTPVRGSRYLEYPLPAWAFLSRSVKTVEQFGLKSFVKSLLTQENRK